MVNVPKVLVVDDGERATDYALSVELAELGFASVTASLEATEEVLALIPTPSAIVLQLPRNGLGAAYKQFLEVADRLRIKGDAAGIPVILVDPAAKNVADGGFSAVIRSQIGLGVPPKQDS